MKALLANFGIRVVLTAHPTQFYTGSVLAISSDLTQVINDGDIALARNLLEQLGRTPFYRKQKPTVFHEAESLMWYLNNVFYPAIGELVDRIYESFPGGSEKENKLITMNYSAICFN